MGDVGDDDDDDDDDEDDNNANNKPAIKNVASKPHQELNRLDIAGPSRDKIALPSPSHRL